MSAPETINESELRQAVEALTGFIGERAKLVADEVGFGWRASRTAPATFEALRREHHCCQASGLPLRVSSLHSETSLFTPATNLALRFWHDLTHVRLAQPFTYFGEIEVGQAQLEEVCAAGFRPRSLVWRLLFVDTIGQTECCRRTGGFPGDQTRFARAYLIHGLPTAIRLEAEHTVAVDGTEGPFDQRSALPRGAA